MNHLAFDHPVRHLWEKLVGAGYDLLIVLQLVVNSFAFPAMDLGRVGSC